jgi:hypothetical protein
MLNTVCAVSVTNYMWTSVILQQEPLMSVVRAVKSCQGAKQHNFFVRKGIILHHWSILHGSLDQVIPVRFVHILIILEYMYFLDPLQF